MCLRGPYQAQTGTRNDKTQITCRKMICRWIILSAAMRLHRSYYLFFFLKINVCCFRIIKLYGPIRFNDILLYKPARMNKSTIIVRRRNRLFWVFIASYLRNMFLPTIF